MIKQSFHSIEGLRGYMAWWVVVIHAFDLGGAPGWLPGVVERALRQGDVAVNVFIIVSGFVITHLRLTSNENYPEYIVRRFFRLAPIYFFCIAISIWTVAYYREVFIDLPWPLYREMRVERLLETDAHWWQHLFAHATLLHGVLPESVLKYSSTSFLAPAWSLSLEWQFYLLAPLIVLAMKRNLRWVAGGAAVMLALDLLTNRYLRDDYQQSSMLLLSLRYFTIGIVSRLLLDHLPALKIGALPVAVGLAAAAVVLRSMPLLVWAPFFAIVLAQSGRIRPLGRIGERLEWFFTSNGIVRTLGKVSYSTYLIHVPLLCIVAHFVGKSLPLTDRHNLQLAIVLAIVLLPLVSWLLYRWIERPFIGFGKDLTARMQAAKAVAIATPLTAGPPTVDRP